MRRKPAPRNRSRLDADALALIWLALRCDAESSGRGPRYCAPVIDAEMLDRLSALRVIERDAGDSRVRLTAAGDHAAAMVKAALDMTTRGALGQVLTSTVGGLPSVTGAAPDSPVRSASPKAGGREATATPVLRVRVELEGIEPAIWRVLEIDADCTFFDLHVALNAAMGWADSHLHHFLVGLKGRATRKPVCYRFPEDEGFDRPFDDRPEHEHRVADSVPIGEAFHYEYDFGDGWMHRVVVEAQAPREPGIRYPRLLAGARACPPEDCGGLPGYERLLEILGDPRHEEHNDLLEWLGGRFDPEAFDAAAVRFPDARKRLRALLGVR